MNDSRIDEMRKARDKPAVMLARYNQVRSKHPGKLVCAFEGHDDVTFYDAMFSKINANILYAPIVCNGKDHVLGLRNSLADNVSLDRSLVRYFVDWDFDGLKGNTHSPEIYFTPCYSFENLLVNRATLETLLRGEFRCNDEHGASDMERIGGLFQARLDEFISCMREANHLLFCARISGHRLLRIENDLKKYLILTVEQIAPAPNRVLHELLGYKDTPDQIHLALSKDAFDQLDPLRDWRGKFIFAFFQKFLACIKEDRGCKSPRFFTEKATVTFAPMSDIFRTLAVSIAVPECLKTFVLAFSNETV